MDWPPFDSNGDLPTGVYTATLDQVLQHFATQNPQRASLGRRLERIYKLVLGTGQLARFVVFGSFITAKPVPGDVDIFIMMEDSFDSQQVKGEAAMIFNHQAAQTLEGASVFWIRKLAAIGGEQGSIEHWQITRYKTRRGIVEVVSDDQE